MMPERRSEEVTTGPGWRQGRSLTVTRQAGAEWRISKDGRRMRLRKQSARNCVGFSADNVGEGAISRSQLPGADPGQEHRFGS